MYKLLFKYFWNTTGLKTLFHWGSLKGDILSNNFMFRYPRNDFLIETYLNTNNLVSS